MIWTEILEKKQKNNFEKDLLMNNAVFGKNRENVWNIEIKFVTRERTRNYLVSEANYYTTKFIAESILAIQIKTKQILMNKFAHLGLSILELGKVLMLEFWFEYVKQNLVKKQNKVIWIETVSLYT